MSEESNDLGPMATQEPPPQEFAPVPREVFKPGEIDFVENGNVSGEEVVEALKDVIDPELGINIVDLGLVYGVAVAEDNSIILSMTLTSAACPLTDGIERQAQMVLGPYSTDVTIEWVWLPPWGHHMITEDGREQLRSLGFAV